MRSILIAAAHGTDELARLLDCEADALIIDLAESSGVENQRRREAAADVLVANRSRPHRKKVFVGVNGLDTGLIEADLDAILPHRPDGVLLREANGGLDVQHLGAKLAVREAENDLPDGSTLILPSVTGTPAALFAMKTYAGASRRTCGLMWGVECLSNALASEATRLPDGSCTPPYLLARNLTLFAAAHAGVDAVDRIFENVRDTEGLRQECEAARRDGFAAKLAIHPDQISIINEVFTPSTQTIEKAGAVIAAFAASPNARFVIIEGRMHDRTALGHAHRVLARARP